MRFEEFSDAPLRQPSQKDHIDDFRFPNSYGTQLQGSWIPTCLGAIFSGIEEWKAIDLVGV